MSAGPQPPDAGAAGADGAEADARLARMDRVAVLYGEITAATREFLRALAESDRERDWEAAGFRSCAEWLSWRIGITRDAAGEKVRAARALERLPQISAAMERGEISFSKVRALTRAATPANEAELLAYAKACSAAGLERLVRGWKTLGRLDEARAERLRHRLRRFSVFPDNDGMYVVKGVLPPEVGALLMRAIEAASDALYREAPVDDERPDPAQLRADALALVAERALAAGFGGRAAAAQDGEAAASDSSASDSSEAPVSGTRAERYQVLLHVDRATLREHGEGSISELEDGTRLAAESARRLTCDCALSTVATGPDGSVLEVGRKTRTVPPAVRRALEVRDRGCRFPGCGLRFNDAHHVVHWADGGETSLRNLILLCARHHRAVHEGSLRVCLDSEGQAVFFGPGGTVIASTPPMPELPPNSARDPAGALAARNRARGVAPDWRSCLPGFQHDREVPWEIEARALEAMDEVIDRELREIERAGEVVA
ncbi:MAG TPA: DUF222 domain-containing protein [Longimicrobiales bacterium]|nr:DUF222 domain-containing protein [Longimicrobiales bacterium]